MHKHARAGSTLHDTCIATVAQGTDMIVAIDGPAGSGKSTVAKNLAERLGFHYLDTGAMYRAVALTALRRGVDPDNERAVTSLARDASIEFIHDDDAAIPTRILFNGEDVSAAIRAPEVDEAVSAVARLPRVREAMVERQRAQVSHGNLVAEGRDIGTVVFPDAELKVFLTASPEERARRRHAELYDRGVHVGRDEVQDAMSARDTADSTRKAAPLAAASDARVLDTTDLDIAQVVEAIAAMVEGAR